MEMHDTAELRISHGKSQKAQKDESGFFTSETVCYGIEVERMAVAGDATKSSVVTLPARSSIDTLEKSGEYWAFHQSQHK